ncbi:hypothetical protein SNEBB_009352 [Seison nebaliae]|nr:hypothetical protein SNEBB_009352 [Seison nebaliae]
MNTQLNLLLTFFFYQTINAGEYVNIKNGIIFLKNEKFLNRYQLRIHTQFIIQPSFRHYFRKEFKSMTKYFRTEKNREKLRDAFRHLAEYEEYLKIFYSKLSSSSIDNVTSNTIVMSFWQRKRHKLRKIAEKKKKGRSKRLNNLISNIEKKLVNIEMIAKLTNVHRFMSETTRELMKSEQYQTSRYRKRRTFNGKKLYGNLLKLVKEQRANSEKLEEIISDISTQNKFFRNYIPANESSNLLLDQTIRYFIEDDTINLMITSYSLPGELIQKEIYEIFSTISPFQLIDKQSGQSIPEIFALNSDRLISITSKNYLEEFCKNIFSDETIQLRDCEKQFISISRDHISTCLNDLLSDKQATDLHQNGNSCQYKWKREESDYFSHQLSERRWMLIVRERTTNQTRIGKIYEIEINSCKRKVKFMKDFQIDIGNENSCNTEQMMNNDQLLKENKMENLFNSYNVPFGRSSISDVRIQLQSIIPLN